MGYTSKLKYFVVLIASVLCVLSSKAQREKNYIYLFDCTGSMKTNGLWETSQSALDNNISLRATIPGSHFTVIPFGNNPYETFSFSNAEYPNMMQPISKAFATYIAQAKFTNISDILKAGFQKVNVNKDNEIYLFTDGMPNGGDSPQKVAQTINEWCANHRNAKLFYVALTNGVINPVIRQAIDACPDASIVQCEDGIVPVITDVSTDVYTTLEDLDNEIALSFGIPGDYNLTSSCTDELFNLSIVGNKASKEKVRIKITPKRDFEITQLHQTLQGDEYIFQATIQCADRGFMIANPTVNVHVLDEVPTKLTIAQGVDGLQAKGAKWYDSFLWSDESHESKVTWDLTPDFKNELQDSRLDLRFQTGEGQTDDFQTWFNGQSIQNGSIISIRPGEPALLEVRFNHNATTGKRYFLLTPVKIESLTFINDKTPDDYEGTSLRTDYDIVWNPLKTFLFWLGIVLIAALVFWLAILRRIFFPAIKMGKVTLMGPGSYYVSKKIKGARKVVLTSKRRTQNIFSRIFTGEVRFVKADPISPEISIVPAGGKKKVKLRSEGASDNWEVYPSSIFGQDEKGTLTNRTTNEKSEIEFS